MNNQNSIPELLTVNQFVKRFPAFTTGGLRFQIFQEKQNGLYDVGAIVRVNKRVLIDVKRYFQWIEDQNPNRGNANV